MPHMVTTLVTGIMIDLDTLSPVGSGYFRRGEDGGSFARCAISPDGRMYIVAFEFSAHEMELYDQYGDSPPCDAEHLACIVTEDDVDVLCDYLDRKAFEWMLRDQGHCNRNQPSAKKRRAAKLKKRLESLKRTKAAGSA